MMVNTEEELEEGDWAYLKLQPYRQVSVYMRKNAKLATRFYCPFQVIKKINSVKYKLGLPHGSRIYPIFHISLLKRYHVACLHLSEVLEDRWQNNPHTIGSIGDSDQKQEIKPELLIHWQGLSPVEATWEDQVMIQAPFSEFFLGDKEVFRG